MKKAITQVDRIIDYITKNGSITRLSALRDLGVMNLPGRIHDIRNHKDPAKRHDVQSETVCGKNRYGEIVSYVRYTF